MAAEQALAVPVHSKRLQILLGARNLLHQSSPEPIRSPRPAAGRRLYTRDLREEGACTSTEVRARLRLLLGLEYRCLPHGAFQNLTPSVQRESALQRLCYPFGRRSLGDSTKTGRLLVVSLRV
jgi:hypothetical protein